MKEGKTMEKKAEEYVKQMFPHYKGDDFEGGTKEAFIAGWQEQDKEIERLKGLIFALWWKKIYSEYYSLHHPDTNENLWEKFQTENNL